MAWADTRSSPGGRRDVENASGAASTPDAWRRSCVHRRSGGLLGHDVRVGHAPGGFLGRGDRVCEWDPALKVEDIDADGRIRFTVLQGGQQTVSAFTACYNQKANENMVAAARVGSPARIVESRSATEASAAPASARVTSVPMQTRNNRFLVPVILNEKQPATFLLDTGASITVITPDLARRAGIEVPSAGLQSRARMASEQEVDVSVIRLKSIRIGMARVDNLGVALYELGGMDKVAQPPLVVDGLLGADVLSRFTTTINPDAGRLTLQLCDLPRKE